MNSSIPFTNDFEPFWMPYTANRQFKSNPRLLVSARDMHYVAADGRRILDGTAGLWCCNAGHAQPRIVEAVQKQVVELDYVPAFQMGHSKAFELSSRLVQLAPRGLDHVFFGSNRKMFGRLLVGADHIRHTHDPARSAFSRGLPEHGEEFSDDLERVIALHDASTIAAVIVEPIAGSTGVKGISGTDPPWSRRLTIPTSHSVMKFRGFLLGRASK